jgi:hypothetical protein
MDINNDGRWYVTCTGRGGGERGMSKSKKRRKGKRRSESKRREQERRRIVCLTAWLFTS